MESHLSTYSYGILLSKYEYDDEWEWCEELVFCQGYNDYKTVIFEDDFCEGQTCVKDISIVPLDDIVEYYVKNNIHEISQWVDDGDPCTLACGTCGYRVARYNNTKFCPDCGSPMKGYTKTYGRNE